MTRALLSLAVMVFLSTASHAASTGTLEYTISAGGQERTYFLHVPGKLPADRPAALVLVFHGGSGTPAQIERESKFSEIADREGFLVAYPAGWRRSWNDGRATDEIPAQREKIDDLAFVARLIDDVSRYRRVDPGRVYATGISNGAMFSHWLAAHLSSRIAAIAPVAGSMAEPLEPIFKPEQPVSVLMLMGTADPLVHYGGGEVTPPGIKPRGRVLAAERAAQLWAASNAGSQPAALSEDLADKDPSDGCRVKVLTYSGGRNGTEVVLYRLEGGGHTWPGGTQYLPKHRIGGVCRDINGAEVIWDFFRKHPKP